MKTVNGQLLAWLSAYQLNEDPSNLTSLTFSNQDMSECGWTQVGTAEISVTLLEDSEILSGKLSSLDEAEKRVKADAQNKLTEIERQRQQLLAIEYRP